MTIGAIGNRDASYDEAASVDDDARARIAAQQADESRKRADAAAQTRLYAHYTSGTCSPATGVDGGTCGRDLPIHARSIDTNDRAEVKRYLDRLSVLEASPSSSPHELAWLRAQAPALRAAQQKLAAADRAAAQLTYAVATVVRPNAKIDSFSSLGTEIVRLRGELAKPHDAALDGPIRARLAELQRKWVESAKATGMRLPEQNGIDARTATDAQIRGAMMWMEIGGVVPFGRLMQGGADAYRRELVEEATLRKPGGLEALLAMHHGDDVTQSDLIARAMKRAGVDGTCHTGDTPQTMLARYYAAVAAKQRAGDESVRAMPTLGHDGLVFANADDAERYRIAQTIAAANPGTTFGSIAASLRALNGGTLEEIRAAGEAGNMVEGLGGGVAPALGQGKKQEHFDTTRPPDLVTVLPNAQRPGMPRGLVVPEMVPRPSGMDGVGVRVTPMVRAPTREGIAKRDAASARWVAEQRLPSGRHWTEATFEEFVTAFRTRRPKDGTPTKELALRYQLGERFDPDKNDTRDVRGRPIYATTNDTKKKDDIPCSSDPAYQANGRAVTFAEVQNHLSRAEQEWRAARGEVDRLVKAGAPETKIAAARDILRVASHNLGEVGSEAYVAARYPGPPPPELIFPPPGRRSTRDEFDRVYRVSDRYGRSTVVVEAKGNRGGLSKREAGEGDAFQGSRQYLDATISVMENSKDPVVQRAGVELRRQRTNIAYVEVKTAGGTTTKIDGRDYDITVDTGVRPQER